jgi:hypothetical protein
MDISKDLIDTIKRASRETAEILGSMRKEVSDRCDWAWDETHEVVVKTKEILADVKDTLEIEAEATRDIADGYLEKAEKIQVELDLAMLELSETVKEKSVDGAEAAIANTKKALDKAEELLHLHKSESDPE